jgi:2-dehydropantoate 2-reductase
MRHVIIGAGAVGAALAAQFTLAGIETLLIARGAQLDHLQTHGLTYRRPGGSQTLPLVVSDLAGYRPAPEDILWLAVKTQDAGALLPALARFGLPLVTLQNGLETERLALRLLPRLYGAVLRTPAVYTETGTVSVLAEPAFAALSLGRVPEGTDALSARLVADLTRAGAVAEERPDILRWKAQKLIYNVKNVVEVFSGNAEEVFHAAEALAQEAWEVLTEAGLDPAREAERKVPLDALQIRRDLGAPAGQSTWQSFQRGQSHEVDYLNGEIVLQARLLGRAAPWNEAAQSLAAALFATSAAPGATPIARLIERARG